MHIGVTIAKSLWILGLINKSLWECNPTVTFFSIWGAWVKRALCKIGKYILVLIVEKYIRLMKNVLVKDIIIIWKD